MKALKSKLASELLADPVARVQLRDFLANRHRVSDGDLAVATQRFYVQHPDGTRFELKVVPKATRAL
jgi:hypothetical protein